MLKYTRIYFILCYSQRVVYQDLQKFSKHRPQNEMVTLKSPKTSKISDTNKHTSNDEEITERPTSPSLVNISEAKSILEVSIAQVIVYIECTRWNILIFILA